MQLPSTDTEKNVKNVAWLMIQLTMGVLLFAVLLALSVDSKPTLDEVKCARYEACPEVDPNGYNVHVVPHSHDDVGWLKTVDQYYFDNVQQIISSVVDALLENPERKYSQVETAFFKMWWERQSGSVRQNVIDLVNGGQFEIINGAWSMNDEADVNYQSTIDQFTLGLRYLDDNLGKCGRPRVGWQIDPFGHSREHASINAQMGFDGLLFARLDYRDRDRRHNDRAMDIIWRGSSNLGNSSDIFTSVLEWHYSAPSGFCFDVRCNDEPIIDDTESPDYNYERRVREYGDSVRGQFPHYSTNQVLSTMGDDFTYQAAITTYTNLDRLIKGFQIFNQTYLDKPIRIFYSTPSCYSKAVNEYVKAHQTEGFKLELKTDDFFPYTDGVNSYVTGFFTSRPASKHFERVGNNLLQVSKQLAAHGQESYYNPQITSLKEALGVMQHHDAITGTEMQHVANNYHLILYEGILKGNEAASKILSRLISGVEDTDFNLDSCLFANVSACSRTESGKFTVVVYNPLSRPVTSFVNLPVYTSSKNWKILDPEDDEVEYQIDITLTDFSYVKNVRTAIRTLVFAAKDLPPLGFKVYRVESTSAAPEEVPDVTPTRLVGYDDTKFEINEINGLLKSITMNNATVDVAQDFLYYFSSDHSGTYVFQAKDNTPTRIATGPITTTLVSGNVSLGVLQEFGTWARQFIKIYKEDQTFIEFDWVIGPISMATGGKEVITKFTTSLDNAKTFYTDSNGRELLKRVLNYRPDYQYTNEDPVSGNYYPVTSKILIKDEQRDLEFAVLTDRPQGGSSVQPGEIELMVHRSLQKDDFRKVREALNEQEYNQGIVVRGKHYVVVGKSSGNGQKSLAAIERDIAQRKHLAAWTFVTDQEVSNNLKNLKFSGLTRPLPENVKILTLEPWNEDTLLIRLEHVLELGEDADLSKEVNVDLSELFTQFTIKALEETTLDGNALFGEVVRLDWPGSTATANQPSRELVDLKVSLVPMQIRTFRAKIFYN